MLDWPGWSDLDGRISGFGDSSTPLGRRVAEGVLLGYKDLPDYSKTHWSRVPRGRERNKCLSLAQVGDTSQHRLETARAFALLKRGSFDARA